MDKASESEQLPDRREPRSWPLRWHETRCQPSVGDLPWGQL